MTINFKFEASWALVLRWWKMFALQFPRLAHTLCVAYSVQTAISKSERVFSYAGNTVTLLRNIQDAEKVENLIIVKLKVNLLNAIRKLK